MSCTRGRTRLMAEAVAMSSIRDDVSDTVDRDDGMTALLWSAYNGHKDAIELLLDI
eukprot:gene10698-13718_t